MGILTAAIDEMAAEFDRLKVEILDLLKRKPQTVEEADNALAYDDGTTTSTIIVSDGRAVATAHATNYLNPHGVTAEGVGGLNSATVDASLANRIPEGILPIARYGALSGAAIPVSSTGLTVMWTAEVHAVMMGRYRPAPVYSVTLQPNTTYNVYLRYNGTKTSYLVTTDDLAETTTSMYLGRIITGASAVTSNTVTRVTRIDTYRVTATPSGSALPVTVGTPNIPDTKLANGWF